MSQLLALSQQVHQACPRSTNRVLAQIKMNQCCALPQRTGQNPRSHRPNPVFAQIKMSQRPALTQQP
eukprot:3105310-Rhodomonas_salina.1